MTNITTEKAYVGYYAYNPDEYDGAPDAGFPSNVLGHGMTTAAAEADYREQRGLPPRIPTVYENRALDQKHFVATAYLRYRLSLPHCKASQVDSMARLMRVVDEGATA